MTIDINSPYYTVLDFDDPNVTMDLIYSEPFNSEACIILSRYFSKPINYAIAGHFVSEDEFSKYIKAKEFSNKLNEELDS